MKLIEVKYQNASGEEGFAVPYGRMAGFVARDGAVISIEDTDEALSVTIKAPAPTLESSDDSGLFGIFRPLDDDPYRNWGEDE